MARSATRRSRTDAYAGLIPGWECSLVAERIMLRGNRYALAAALDGVPLEPRVQPLHGCDTR